MTEKPSAPKRSLPVIQPVPPPPSFNPSEVPPKWKLYWLMFWVVAKKVARAPLSLHTWGAMRRSVLSNILPEEILYRWKPYQKGKCNLCGACCKIQFTCSFMVQDTPETTHCTIYQSEHAPKACLTFPVDPLDLHMLQREIGNVCTFYYEGAPDPIPPAEYAKIVFRHLRSRMRKRRPALESAE